MLATGVAGTGGHGLAGRRDHNFLDACKLGDEVGGSYQRDKKGPGTQAVKWRLLDDGITSRFRAGAEQARALIAKIPEERTRFGEKARGERVSLPSLSSTQAYIQSLPLHP